MPASIARFLKPVIAFAALVASASAADRDKTDKPDFKFEASPIGTNYRKGTQTAVGPDKNVRVEISDAGKTAEIVNEVKGKRIRKRLDPGDWTFTCCLISSDGKYVITGARYR